MKNLKRKGIKALFSLKTKIGSGNLDMSILLSLFDKLIRPVIVYGSDIWGEESSTKSIKAMKTLDKWSAQEVMDNDWLKKEAVIHREETINLKELVERLEKENLEIMSELFDCRIEDLKISRNFYLTQFEDNENIEETGILEMDLSQIDFKKDAAMLAIEALAAFITEDSGEKKSRPKSATQLAVERKVFSISTLEEEDEDGLEDFIKEDLGSNDDDDLSANEREQADAYLDNYFSLEDDDYDEFLKLGPLELKLLSISGTSKPLHVQKKITAEEEDAKASAPDEWPVTKEMLYQTVVSQ
ncbi:coiled-coil domain-containing protein 83-like [Saccoglossus kowalevskii]